MKIIHIIAGTWRENGGPSVVVPELVYHQNKIGLDAELWTLAGGEQSDATLNLDNTYRCVRYFKWHTNLRVSLSLFFSLLRINKPTILHVHGLWLFPSWVSFILAHLRKFKLVISPHGVLTDEMLQSSKIKKLISYNIFEKFAIRRSLVHFLSSKEKSNTRNEDIARSVVISNGVREHELIKTNRNKSNIVKLIYFSRVSHIKGIIQFLRYWREIEMSLDIRLQIDVFGPVDKNLLNEFETLISSLNNVEYKGSVYDDKKFEILSQYDALLLPTLGEGYPTVIIEAGSIGLPVITTHEANTDDLFERKLVYIIEMNNLVHTFIEVLNERDEWHEKGKCLQTYIKSTKNWTAIAREWEEVYEKC